MSIIKVEMYTVQCDNCKTTSGKNSEYSCWNDKSYAIEDACDKDWIQEGEKTYCPNCYTLGENDEIIINPGRAKPCQIQE